MNLIEKYKEIINWQRVNLSESLADLSLPIPEQQFAEIEKLLGEVVPPQVRELYSFANGQKDNGEGILFGHGFITADEIIRQLTISRSFVKPPNPVIVNPTKSKELLDQVAAFYLRHAPKRNLFGLKKSWYKMEYACSPNAFHGPYLFLTPRATNDDREIITIKNYKPLDPVIQELHDLEKAGYNWDELHFVLFADGTYNVRRSYFDFDNSITFTSSPANAIRKKYFHYKWLPIFSDFGGNYLGIDLDPDMNGVKGQVINFGRDEEDMFVFANNLDAFFDLILYHININNGETLKNSRHLHDILKELVGNK